MHNVLLQCFLRELILRHRVKHAHRWAAAAGSQCDSLSQGLHDLGGAPHKEIG